MLRPMIGPVLERAVARRPKAAPLNTVSSPWPGAGSRTGLAGWAAARAAERARSTASRVERLAGSAALRGSGRAICGMERRVSVSSAVSSAVRYGAGSIASSSGSSKIDSGSGAAAVTGSSSPNSKGAAGWTVTEVRIGASRKNGAARAVSAAAISAVSVSAMTVSARAIAAASTSSGVKRMSSAGPALSGPWAMESDAASGAKASAATKSSSLKPVSLNAVASGSRSQSWAIATLSASAAGAVNGAGAGE